MHGYLPTLFNIFKMIESLLLIKYEKKKTPKKLRMAFKCKFKIWSKFTSTEREQHLKFHIIFEVEFIELTNFTLH